MIRTACLLAGALSLAAAELPPNRWVELARDAAGGRRGSALRYAPAAGAFFLWGFFDHDPELLQELPVMEAPEYDVVAFDPAEGRWRSHLPAGGRGWERKLPLAYIPRTYSAITTGSERTVLRGPTAERGGVPRPDLNIVFDQVEWHPDLKALVYFTGGLTAAYDPARRHWSDLRPAHSPPPVVGGSLAFDPVNREMLLFGGGHVSERDAAGRLVGYTGTWALRGGDWHPVPGSPQPPPRMNTRLVTDTRGGVLVLFGGDAQDRFLADTWIYDCKIRAWRQSRAPAGPEARAGHFAVYDPQTGWVIVGGGYNRRDLADMWAYDAAADLWRQLAAEVPTGFYLTADIAPEKRLIVLAANTRRPGDRATCNVLYPVRTTYGFRIERAALETSAVPASTRREFISKREPVPSLEVPPPPASLPENRWVLLADGGAPVRTWGSATFDRTRGEILYWGGGHCGYGGSDVDAFDPGSRRWRAVDPDPEFPERAWDHGVRLAGVTFQGAPWTDHGRRIYAYDPLSRLMVMMRAIRSTAGYDPAALADFPDRRAAAPDALVQNPSSYVRYATFTYDPGAGRWNLLGPAPVGMDTLVTTPRGVMGVTVDWPSRLNDAGYQLPWSPRLPPLDNAAFLLDVAAKRWRRISAGQPSPQNLYEVAGLAYDTRRDRLLLHGGGARRDELWALDYRSGRWTNLEPRVASGGPPPQAAREAVWLPERDLLLISGPAPEDRAALAVHQYSPADNTWRRADVAFQAAAPPAAAGQNRAMVYDPRRDLVLLVLGGNQGRAAVYGMRYRPVAPAPRP